MLILKVVDEAHMIYSWGLVESGTAKTTVSHLKVQDKGAFRPYYGKLVRRFLATDDVSLLLMTATCPPQQVDAIMENLKYNKEDVQFYEGELVRSELRLIRRTFKRPLNPSLRGLFANKALVPTASIPPTLIYAGTQNNTLEYLRIISATRGRLALASEGLNSFARRYHASTGAFDKVQTVKDFLEESLAVICCTLALGLGQNWHRVRRVVVVGRQDPSNLIQMVGRAGRDGRRGLGLMLVESYRTRAKNTPSDFSIRRVMSDDDRMDAISITPVCLRVALAVDLK
jgi:superfamily II DNA helicase RecQ